ncbi:MAG: hypothetical protein Q4P29_03360 [Tissierellia bacterium]|nr:hypothetical protein [Tissierellia bacterium]
MKNRFILISIILLTLTACSAKEKVKDEDLAKTESNTVETSAASAYVLKSKEELIENVKEIFNIDDSFDEFELTEQTTNDYDMLILNWNNKEQNESINVLVDYYGNILEYAKYPQNGDTKNFDKATISYEEAVSIAKDLIERCFTQTGFEIALKDQGYCAMYHNISENFCVPFQLKKDNIKVLDGNIYVNIDKYNAKVNSLYSDWIYYSTNKKFQSIKNIISTERAKEILKEKNKLYLNYLKIYDYDKNQNVKVDYKLVYSPAYFGSMIDPIKEKITIMDDRIDNLKSAMETGSSDIAANELSEETKKLIADMDKAKSLEEAEKKAREIANIENMVKLKSSRLGKLNPRSQTGNLYWTLLFSDNEDRTVEIVLDANNFDLYRLNDSNLDYDIETNSNAKEAIIIGTEFINKYSKNILNSVELTEYSKTDQKGLHKLDFVRKIDQDLYVLDEGLHLEIDTLNKQIVYFERTEFDILPQLSTEDLISIDEAYNIYFDIFDFDLRYILDFNDYNKFDLYYTNSNNYWTEIIDAHSGKPLDNAGNVINLDEEIKYDDLDSSQYKKEIIKLLDKNIGYINGSIKPKDNLQQRDFLILIHQILMPYYEKNLAEIDDETLYNNLLEFNIIEDENINPNRELTVLDIAKYIIRLKNLDSATTLGDIYNNIYGEFENLTSKDKAYIVLAGSLNILEEPIVPDRIVTRDEGLKIIYNYMKTNN